MVDDGTLLMPANCPRSLTFPTLSHTLMMLAIIQMTLLGSNLSDEMKHKGDVMQLRQKEQVRNKLKSKKTEGKIQRF